MGELTDLEKSLENKSRALALTPDGHPHLSLRHFHYAISCHHQYQQTGHTSHLTISLHSFRKASQLLNGLPRRVFDNARRWANLASQYPYLSPIEAFRATIDLLPHFIWLGATTTQRYHDISLAENLAVRAALAAILSSEYTLALEWLEHARCVVWNQSLILRSPLDDLASSYPELASQIHSVSHQLHSANSGAPASGEDSDSSMTPEHRHRLAKKYSELIAQARSLPSFEHFLKPMNVSGLTRVARNGPIVVINCHDHRCDALLVIPGQDHVTHLPLLDFTQEAARTAHCNLVSSLKRVGMRERGVKIWEERPANENIGRVLATLWKNIVKPVLDYLAYTNDATPDPMPHITWCPTGALSFLPLHAAGDYDLPRSRVFDYVVSSYTPTLAALHASSSTPVGRGCRVLAVGQSVTPGYSPLPGTIAELGLVQGHAEGRAEYSQLIDEQATTTAVLDAMEQHDWVHLACHASQHIKDPTKSGFHLHNGTLDLTAINQRTLRGKGLAFLSACETATGDEKLPDEAIHLASGMLMAGYRSVIATMWSVKDDDAPFVADKVYEQLMRDGKLGNGEAGRALHKAVAGLRDRVGEKEFGRWVPYIHIGS
ncbi:unnamed protein product [Rhizoctonia solani]|uniref:CHAT domain-containing protein n=1 Tax=Rhizoctonia solani TaxID=456999 RepID=A0A8H2WH93_9AGAM|nr:unnamed protein product [Rhizoctonia solani]